MTERIYSDICAAEIQELPNRDKDDIEVYLWDGSSGSGFHKPALVLPNLLAVKRMRDYLDKVMVRHKGYFRPRKG